MSRENIRRRAVPAGRGREGATVRSRVAHPARHSGGARAAKAPAAQKQDAVLVEGAVLVTANFADAHDDGTVHARLVVDNDDVSAKFFLGGHNVASTLPQTLDAWRGALGDSLAVEVEGLRNGELATVTGRVSLEARAPGALTLTLTLAKGLDLPLPTTVELRPRPVKGKAKRAPGGGGGGGDDGGGGRRARDDGGGGGAPGTAVREIEVRFHEEAALGFPRAALDAALTGLAQAGFRPTEQPAPAIPRQADGATFDTWGLTQLHALMVDLAGRRVAEPAWRLEMLLLGGARRSGLRGVMFDTGRVLPRQGAAVFARAFDGVTPLHERSKRLGGTLLHEMGHALNLVHTFERAVGRPRSLSAMNYDWRYAQETGGSVDDYWKAFRGTFDADPERRALSHRLEQFVQPGGAPFHSFDYWTDGPREVVPTRPRPLAGLALTLHAPPAGRVFEFGTPIFLEVRLTNTTGVDLSVPSWLLDPKAGFIEVRVRRRNDARPGGFGDPSSFLPIAQRCFSLDDRTQVHLTSGQSRRDNLNLSFGADGFLFNEPGAYEVTAVLTPPPGSLPPALAGRPLTLASPPLLLRVAYPKTRADERVAAELLEAEVGLFFALGGTRALEGARRRLEELVERRQPRSGPVRDPLVAAVTRCAAIDATRDYVRFSNDKWSSARPDLDEAARQFARLDDGALRCFDARTASETRRLAHWVLEARAGGGTPPPGVGGLAAPVPHQAAAAPVAGAAPAAGAAITTWTAPRWAVFVYIAAESANLELPLRQDLRELRQRTTSPDAPRVIVQVDTLRADGQRRYALEKGELHELPRGLRGETSTGDPAVLRDFLSLRRQLGPHDRTFLVLWGHSQGVGAGFEPPAFTLDGLGAADIAFDETSGDALKTNELAQALKLGAGKRPIDIVGFDSCFMGSVEIAVELSGAACYLLAPQTASPLTGWHYDRVLDAIIAQPDVEPEKLGLRLLDQVGVGPVSPPALSLIDLSRAPRVHGPFRQLVQALRAAARSRVEFPRLLAAFESAAWSGARQFLDVADLCRRLARGTRDARLREAARALEAALRPGHKRFIVDQRCATTEVLSGVSVYCPWPRANAAEVLAQARNAEVDEDDYRALMFSLETDWADFVLDPDLLRAVRRAQRARDFSRRFASGPLPLTGSPGAVNAVLALLQERSGSTKSPSRAGDDTKSRGQSTEEPPTKSPDKG
jgi:hypothetical protein